MSRRLLVGAVLAGALLAPASAQAESITLKGATKWRTLGRGTAITSMTVISRPHRGVPLRHIGATSSGLGCWASGRVHESSYCLVLQNCRMGECSVRGTFPFVTVRVSFRRPA